MPGKKAIQSKMKDNMRKGMKNGNTKGALKKNEALFREAEQEFKAMREEAGSDTEAINALMEGDSGLSQKQFDYLIDKHDF